MLSTKNLPVDKFKLSKFSTKWTGHSNMPEYNPQNQNVIFEFSYLLELSNISNMFHTTLLKPFTADDDIHLPQWKLNYAALVEEYRWQVEKVLDFISQAETDKP